MSEFKPVTISRGAFAFCRYTIALMIWIAIILRLEAFVLASFIVLLLSYILKVEKAPLIVLYTNTVNRIIPTEKVLVDEKGIRFAHLVGTVFSGLCCVLLYFVYAPIGWAMTFALAILKTSAAFGFCSALKLYKCMNGGNCCRVGRAVRRRRNV